MKDETGLYYHPDPSEPKTRVYVRESAAGIEFRMWRADRPEVWDRHEWLVYDVIRAAVSLYKERGSAADPLAFYDLNVARALLKEEARKNARGKA